MTEGRSALAQKEDTEDEVSVLSQELAAFSYSISHDLRAPLRAIDGFSQILLEEYGGALDARGREYVERIRAGTQRMGAFINSLLALSRVTTAQMRPTVVDLSSLAHDAADKLRRSTPERKVEFVIADGLTAEGDPVLLRSVIESLMGNAWKFTRDQSRPRIEFGALDRSGDPIFFVRDNGVGFDMAYASRLFAPFQRLHTQEEFDGLGTGLALVSRVVRRHGGRVWPGAEPGAGATFLFTLKRRAE